MVLSFFGSRRNLTLDEDAGIRIVVAEVDCLQKWNLALPPQVRNQRCCLKEQEELSGCFVEKFRCLEDPCYKEPLGHWVGRTDMAPDLGLAECGQRMDQEPRANCCPDDYECGGGG